MQPVGKDKFPRHAMTEHAFSRSGSLSDNR